MDARQRNLEMLHSVAAHLGPLRDEVVFLGGATTSLLIADPGAFVIRPTRDVDVIVEVGSHIEYVTTLSKQLRGLGFREDKGDGAPLGRWIIDGIKVDVMPTDPAVLGFKNRWYPLALATPDIHPLEGLSVRVVTPPLFLGTKLEAFRGRGRGDFQASHDIEDIIAVVDGRPEIVAEIAKADGTLRRYLAETFREYLRDSRFVAALPGHLPGDAASQARVPIVLERLAALTRP